MKKILILIVSLFSISILNCSDKKRKKREERSFDFHGGAAAQQQAPAESESEDEEGDEKFDYDSEDENGEPAYHGGIALMNAVRNNDEEGVRKALEFGTNPNGNWTIFRNLIEGSIYDPMTNAYVPTDMDLYALMVAASAGNINIVRMLLEAGADPELNDGLGHDASHYAKIHNHPEIVHLLQTFKRNPVKIKKWYLAENPYTSAGDSYVIGGKMREFQGDPRTGQVMILVTINGNLENVPIKSDLIFKAIKMNNEGLFLKALHQKENINGQTPISSTSPLMYAAQMNRPELVELLLVNFADSSLVDKDNKRFIDYARLHPQVMAVVQKYINHMNDVEQHLHESGLPKDVIENILRPYLANVKYLK